MQFSREVNNGKKDNFRIYLCTLHITEGNWVIIQNWIASVFMLIEAIASHFQGINCKMLHFAGNLITVFLAN